VEQAHSEAVPEGPREQPASCRKEEAPSLFNGTVELALPPPISLEQMLRIHKYLKETPQMAVLNLGGSVDKGITIRLELDEPVPLLSLIGGMPGVGKVSEELPSAESVVPGRQGGESHPVRRIIATTRSGIER